MINLVVCIVLSELFDHCFLNKFGGLLTCSDLQFVFKRLLSFALLFIQTNYLFVTFAVCVRVWLFRMKEFFNLLFCLIW